MIDFHALKREYMDICDMPTRPSWEKPREGTVIDEEASVRWNREEVARQRAQWEDLCRECRERKYAAEVKLENKVIDLIANEAFNKYIKETARAKARILWDFIKSQHEHSEAYDYADEYIDVVESLMA